MTTMSDEDVEFVKPKESIDSKYKRRSSFFRRSIGRLSFSSDSPTYNEARGTVLLNGSDDTNDRENNKIEYLSKLKKEKEDWENLCTQKMKQEEQLAEKCPQAASSSCFLTEQDKRLLEDRADYLAVGRLMDNVTEAVAVKQLRINSTIEKVERLLTDCEQATKEIAEEIIEYFLDEFDEFGDEE